MNEPNPVMRSRVKALLDAPAALPQVLVKGWARTRRSASHCTFIELNDGSCLANLQLVVPAGEAAHQVAESLGTGAAIAARGALVESPGKGQRWELQVSELELLGAAPPEYPLQKKRHSDEFLRGIAHLRARTNKYGALLRIRSRLAQAIHAFFAARGFNYVHTPIITGNDCEGAGELFRVTTLPRDAAATEQDFFDRPAYLTVSGQLAAETLALGIGDVYTFGPTFRAENSNTSRHMAEFWMLEPEMAFADLDDDIDLAEALLRYLLIDLLEHCQADLALFDRFVSPGLLTRLHDLLEQPLKRITYSEAIDLLAGSGESFEFPVAWGKDLQSEHERWLTERWAGGGVVVTDYPRQIKAFYMRLNDDQRTVAAMDVLLPGIGELIGGSQREERLAQLEARLQEADLPLEAYGWYLDTRRYGSAPHAGFGLGFERLLMLVTGIGNIRDVIPYPRTPGPLAF